MATKKVLGRGLDALLLSDETEEFPDAAPAQEDSGTGGVIRVSPDSLVPGVHQPRTDFSEDSLLELADSIRRHGVISPVLVRRAGEGKYEIIAGERRWRASRLARLDEIPAMVVDAGGDEALELAIVENVQRADLNPMEEAAAYASMMERLDLTQEEVALRVGKERSTVSNCLRLLRLPLSVQESVASGWLSLGHAKVLLSLRTREEMATHGEAAIKKRLSVRQLESRIRKAFTGGGKKRVISPGEGRNGTTGAQAPFLREAGERLRSALGTKVVIAGDENKGRIEIEYYSMETLEGLIERLGQARDFPGA